MKRISAITTVCTVLLCWTAGLTAQPTQLWHTISKEQAPSKVNKEKETNEVRRLQLDFEAFRTLLFSIEKEQQAMVELPLPNGQNEKFRLKNASIMAEGLAKKYPGIRSYAGQGIDNPSASVRLDVSHKGVHAMISSGTMPMVLIDPLDSKDVNIYQSIYKPAASASKHEHFHCSYSPMNDEALPRYFGGLQKTNLCTYRTYRMALACTGEYADFHGGTVPDVLAAMNTTMTRVNGILERDLNITLVLVENNDQLIFLDAQTDPYTNGSGSAMLEQNQTTCDDIIGSANYDIGHVFSTGGGGVAYLASMCKPYKAGGVTGQQIPQGDAFDIDYVTHEIGHQLGANHTQNNDCNRFANAAVEPGSASTIMGYAGICSPNVQSNSDAYFHAFSIQEINAYLDSNTGSSCAQAWDNGNSRPSITTMINYTIPASTPFVLSASASDPDGDGLTYCWEQMDREIASMPPQPSNTVGPCFRSLAPSTDRQRFFPNMHDLLHNEQSAWEVLPAVSRTLNFNLTVRDNQLGGGCIAQSTAEVEVIDTGAPFRVLEPNGMNTWVAQTAQQIRWDVASTDQTPILTSHVDILLSVDGGHHFDIILAEHTPNDGSEEVIVPNTIGDSLRIMIKAGDNIFFDISDQDFTIEGPQALTVEVSDSPLSCAGAADAGLSAEVFGGQAPYSYEWSTGEQGSAIADLGPGQYSLTITDEAGSIVTETIQIDTLKPLQIVLAATDLTCNETNSGSILATVSGGIPPYQFDWTGPNSYAGSGSSITALAGGAYQLVVTDQRSCQQVATIALFDPNTRFYYDADKDGYGDHTKWLDACFEPEGYVKLDGDCEDDNSHVNPGVKEVCDGVDNNCDGQIDEGFDRSWYYLDADGDGYGDPAQGILACVIPPNYTINDQDCQDADSSIYPGAPEICDGQDNDCDDLIDEGGCRLTMEHGNLKRIGGDWQRIHLQQDYESMVVITNVILASESQKPVVTRIRSVDHNSFEVKLQNPAGEEVDGYYALTYFVVEEGIYTEEEHGINLEAHRMQSSTISSIQSWQLEPQVYNNAYQQPVVLGQVMSYNDPKWSTFWSSSIGDRATAADILGFSIGRHVGEDPDTDRLPETLGYVVIEAGMYELEGTHFYAKLGDDSVRGVSNSSVGYPYETPLGQLDCAVASIATMKGLDGGFPVLFTEDPFGQRSKLMLAIDEDQIMDMERSHDGERVSILAFGHPIPAVSYCETGATSSEYEWIESLSIGDLTHQSGNNGGYGDFSDMEIYAARGEEVLFSLMPGTAIHNYPEYWNIWIDYNQDGDFMDEDEVVLELSSHRGMYIDQFIIPDFAKLGPTKIRIGMKWGDFSPACGVTGWGEVEDYTLVIEPALETRLAETIKETAAAPSSFKTQVYPNPASDLINLNREQGSTALAQWRLTDVSGKILQQQDWIDGWEDSSTSIEVGHLQTGIYYLVLIDQEGKRETLPFAKVP